jgi:hypothetical protein
MQEALILAWRVLVAQGRDFALHARVGRIH